jgi:nucleoside-diphosphate-sugar epimerase
MNPLPLPSDIVEQLGGKTVLVTGGGGYIAHTLIPALVSAGCIVRRWVHSGSSLASAPEGKITDIVGDVRDRDAWVPALEGADIVVHLAAQTSVYAAANDPLEDLQVNVVPLLHMLEACRKRNLSPTIVFAGTATQTGLTPEVVTNEARRDEPVTVYDVHKLSAEHYLKLYSLERFVRGVSLRLANVYGPGPAGSKNERGVLNTMVRRALSGQPLIIYGSGHHVRDYVYVEDVARAFLAAAIRIDQLNGGHYLIGSGRGQTVEGAIKLVGERFTVCTGRAVPVVHVAPPPGLSRIEQRDFVADVSRFATATGWRPQTQLQEGIDLTIASVIRSVSTA